METCQTWESLIERIKELPQSMYSDDVVHLAGWFNTVIWPSYDVQDEVYLMADCIEKIVAEAFSMHQIIGLQSPNCIFQKAPNRRYYGVIAAAHNDESILQIFIHAHHPLSGLDAILGFDAHLPLNDYEQKTKNVLTNLWPYAEYINFANPNDNNSKVQSLDSSKRGFGDIVLKRNGDLVALGYPVFTELGLQLENKYAFSSAGHL